MNFCTTTNAIPVTNDVTAVLEATSITTVDTTIGSVSAYDVAASSVPAVKIVNELAPWRSISGMIGWDVSSCLDEHFIPHMTALPEIVEVIFHDGTHTTIRWADGTATDAACGEGEEYHEYEGFCAAVCKKLFDGTGNAKRVMKEKNLTEQRRIAKEAEEKKRQEEAEALARKKARSKRRYIKKMAKKMLMEDDIRRQAEELAKKMREGK